MSLNSKHVDCINKVRQQLKAADSSIGWIRFGLAGDNGITGQAIEYSQTITKRDGTTKQITGKSYVAHDFCPFCGERYK